MRGVSMRMGQQGKTINGVLANERPIKNSANQFRYVRRSKTPYVVDCMGLASLINHIRVFKYPRLRIMENGCLLYYNQSLLY